MNFWSGGAVHSANVKEHFARGVPFASQTKTKATWCLWGQGLFQTSAIQTYCSPWKMATPFHENRVHHWMPCLFHVWPNITEGTWNTEICTRHPQRPTITIDSWWLTTLHQLKMHGVWDMKIHELIWASSHIFKYRQTPIKLKPQVYIWSFTFIWLACEVTMKFNQKTNKSNQIYTDCLRWIWWIGCTQLLSFFSGLKAIGSVTVQNLQRITSVTNLDVSKSDIHNISAISDTPPKRILSSRKHHSWGCDRFLEPSLRKLSQNKKIVFHKDPQRQPAPTKTDHVYTGHLPWTCPTPLALRPPQGCKTWNQEWCA